MPQSYSPKFISDPPRDPPALDPLQTPLAMRRRRDPTSTSARRSEAEVKCNLFCVPFSFPDIDWAFTQQSERSDSPPLRPIQRNQVLYERLFMHKGRGYPQWEPSLEPSLLPSHQEQGVCIGDVGHFFHGSFCFLFNIYLPADDPIHLNRNRFPEGFSPLDFPLTSTDVRKLQAFPEGSSLDSNYVGRVWSCQDPDEILAFESATATEGTTLTMPEGAYMEELTNISKVRDYISAHAEDWYKFVNHTCRRGVDNGGVRLVVGSDKASSWAVSIYSTISQPVSRLESKDGHQALAPKDVSHKATISQTTRHRPKPNGARDQSLFIRTLNVMLSNEIWEELFPKQPVFPGLKISVTPIGPDALHPSKVLNEYLLKEIPSARMSIVSDREWYSNSIPSMAEPFDDAYLISRVLEKNKVAYKNGAAYFEPKDPDDVDLLNHLISQVYSLIDGTTSVEQYLFGGEGGALEDISQRRCHFLGEMQQELLQCFLVDRVDLSDYYADRREEFPDIVTFLQDIAERARGGKIKVMLNPLAPETDPYTAKLSGHPHRLLTTKEVVHFAGLKLSTNNPSAPGTESIEALRFWLNRPPTEQSDEDRSICLLRLGEVLLRRFSQYHEREDLDEAIFYFQHVSSLTPSSILQLEACLASCEALYQRILFRGNIEDLIELVRALNVQMSYDLTALLKRFTEQLRDPPKKEISFFDPLTLPVPEPIPIGTSIRQSAVNNAGICPRIRLLTKTTLTSTRRFLQRHLGWKEAQSDNPLEPESTCHG